MCLVVEDTCSTSMPQNTARTACLHALFRFCVRTLDGACAKRSVSPLSARTPLQSRASLATVPACVACRLGPMQGCSSLVPPLSGAASSVSSTKLQFDKPARLNTAPGEARTEQSVQSVQLIDDVTPEPCRGHSIPVRGHACIVNVLLSFTHQLACSRTYQLPCRRPLPTLQLHSTMHGRPSSCTRHATRCAMISR